jgi:uncharacterized small protein (DUF1192 family)
MDFGFLAYLSWREILAMIIVLLVIYILFAFMRIHRLRDGTRFMQQSSLETAHGAVRSYTATQALEDTEPDAEASANERAVHEETPAPTEKWTRNEPPPETPELRRIEILEQDIAQLRQEIGRLRAEVQALREERQHEMEKIQIAQNASPFYSDAMQLATQGREAADISVLCGISRAEAELVVALVKSQASG